MDHSHSISRHRPWKVPVIHEAEADLEVAKIDLDKARDEFAKIRLRLRDKQMEGAGRWATVLSPEGSL